MVGGHQNNDGGERKAERANHDGDAIFMEDEGGVAISELSSGDGMVIWLVAVGAI